MDNLNVYTNNQVNNQSGNRRALNPKIIFVILGIVILAEVIYAVRVLTAPTPAPPALVKNVAESNSVAKISLTAPKLSWAVGEVIPVTVAVDTGGRSIGGVDLIVSFDPKAVEVVPESLRAGKIFSEYPLLNADINSGLISISGVSSVNSNFSGQGEFATLNLKVKAPGKTFLVINFQKGTTTTTNLVEAETSQNILETVDNLELNIQ